jgi:hypothetical protein
MTGPLAYATVTFRNADTGRANERVITVSAGSWRTNDEIAADAVWIVQSWRNVDRDSVKVTLVERAGEIAARAAAERAGRAAV